jgi:hypothetical protein
MRWTVLGLLVSAGCKEPAATLPEDPGAGGSKATGGAGGGATTSNSGAGGDSSNGGTGGDSNNGGTGGDSNNGGGAGAGGAMQCPEPPLTKSDLFACDQPLSCPAVCVHNALGDCSGGNLTCGEELFADEGPGLLLVEGRSGGGNSQLDTLTLLLPGGGAIVQQRERSCDGIPCDVDPIPWQVFQQELCDVHPFHPCGSDACELYPGTGNCTPLITEIGCADLKQALSGEVSPEFVEGEACEESEDPNCESSFAFVLTADSWSPGLYELDIDQVDSRHLCELELVEARSARSAHLSGSAGGSAGAGGAATEPELSLSLRVCQTLENNGESGPSFEFEGGLVVQIHNRRPVQLEMHHADSSVLSQNITPSMDCQVPAIPVTGL